MDAGSDAMGLQVTTLDAAEPLWRDFVASSRSACIYHDARWREVIEEVFRHRCHYLAALEDGRLAGVLPLVEMRSVLFGRFLVSLPFVTYGGIAAENGRACHALAEAAIGLGRRMGANWIELRQRGAAGPDWPCRRHKVALLVSLAGGSAGLWTRLSSRLRGKVRKAQRGGAVFEAGDAAAIPDFYRVFCRNMRDLGTPVYPRRWFESIGRHFPRETRIFAVRRAGRAVAAAFGLDDGERLQLPWICSDYHQAADYMNEFLYWSILEWAAERGYRHVDLGRSTAGGGNHRFKKQWNPEEISLAWYHWTPSGNGMPQLNPDNPRFRLAIRIWQRLPLAFANLLGPRIVRFLP